MWKYAAGAVIFAVLVVGWAYYARILVPQEPRALPQQNSTYSYSTSTFSIQYPSDFTVDESYTYKGVPRKPIAGVKLIVSSAVATGTNLAADSGVSVEWLPRAKNCTGDIFLYKNVRASELSTASTTYSVATTSEGALGNFYEEHIYAIGGSRPCTAVRYFIHSANTGAFLLDTVRKFDRAALLEQFDKIRDSLVLHDFAQR